MATITTAPAIRTTSTAYTSNGGPSLREGFTAPEEQLQDELSSDRMLNLRTDACEQFIDNLELPEDRGQSSATSSNLSSMV
jgi:hypothetical protein